MNITLGKFRIIAYLEGISFLVLLGIAMPMKYIYGNPLMVRYVGWVHGLLFIFYLFCVFILADKEHWPRKLVHGAVLAAILPFGPFIFDRKLLKFHD